MDQVAKSGTKGASGELTKQLVGTLIMAIVLALQPPEVPQSTDELRRPSKR